MNMSAKDEKTTVLLVFLPVKPEARDEFRAKLMEMGGYIAKEPQFVSAAIHEDRDDPDTLVLYETWNASPEDLAEQLKRPYRREYEASLGGLLKAERRIQFLSAPIATVP